MGIINNYDKSLYPSIKDAITFILDGHLLDVKNTIYSGDALNDVLFFLAENDIQHTFIKTPAPVGALCDEVISLVWSEPGAIGNEVWYSRGVTEAKKIHKLSIIVATDDVSGIEAWLNDADDYDMELIDYQREEVVS
jgi:hypothetical protein